MILWVQIFMVYRNNEAIILLGRIYQSMYILYYTDHLYLGFPWKHISNKLKDPMAKKNLSGRSIENYKEKLIVVIVFFYS